ncbi:hypothetical protein GCM10027569_27120 [Flindersiella endophytica]
MVLNSQRGPQSSINAAAPITITDRDLRELLAVAQSRDMIKIDWALGMNLAEAGSRSLRTAKGTPYAWSSCGPTPLNDVTWLAVPF